MNSKSQLSKAVIHGRGQNSRHTVISQSWLGPRGSERFIFTMTRAPNNSFAQPNTSLAHWNLAKCPGGMKATSEQESPKCVPRNALKLCPKSMPFARWETLWSL